MSAHSSLEERFHILTRQQTLVSPADANSLKSLLATKERPKVAWGGLWSPEIDRLRLILFKKPLQRASVIPASPNSCSWWFTEGQNSARGIFYPFGQARRFHQVRTWGMLHCRNWAFHANYGTEVTIFYLDVYGFLVNYVHPMELVAYRRKYYHFLITAILRSLGINLSKIRFVDESSFAYRKEYMVDVLRTCALMKQQDAKDTCEEVGETKILSPLLCCIYQSLSEQYLDIDIQFGGEDQVRVLLT